MRPVPQNAVPLLHGPDETTEGYYQLEEIERAMAFEVLAIHREPVELWYRLLTLYYRGMKGEWDFSDAEGDDVRLMVWGLQSQLLGLGVSSAKAALDLLLAGYYSVAFAAIRHMLETFVQYSYVAVAPMEVVHWYEQPGGLEAQTQPPSCSRMVNAIKLHSQLGLQAPLYDEVYASWRLMCKGAHPSGQGITQTTTCDERKLVFGATYAEELCLVGFDHGLFAVDLLLAGIIGLGRQPDSWRAQFEVARANASTWRNMLRARET